MSYNLARYRATRPIQTQLGRYDSTNNDDVICFFPYPYKHGGRVLIDNSKIYLNDKETQGNKKLKYVVNGLT